MTTMRLEEMCAACGRAAVIYFCILTSKGVTPSICLKCEKEWRGGVPSPHPPTHEAMLAEADSLRAFIEKKRKETAQ